MFEAILIACLYGTPQTHEYCENLVDMRGPYNTENQCISRVIEIKNNLHDYRPELEPKGYDCKKIKK